jgi:tight adherence protein B
MSGWLVPLTYLFAFMAVVILAQSVSGLIFTSRDGAQRVNRRLSMLEAGLNPENVYASLVRRTPAPKLDAPFLLKWHEHADLYLRQAGMSLSPARLVLITGAVAGLLWLAALSLAHSHGAAGFLLNGFISLVSAVALTGVGAWLWVRRKRNARIKQIERQLPIGLDIINRALRAGHPVISAVRLAADELSDPIGTEFGLIVDETAYGFDFREALTNFARRTGSGDAHFFAVSISIQTETGGNLSEILEGLATVMRGRHTLAQRVKSLSSEGRTSAILISVLPFFMVAAQMLFHPTVYSDKFSDPIFWPVVAVTLVDYLIGWVLVQRIVNFQY